MLLLTLLVLLEPSIADRVESRLQKTGLQLSIAHPDPLMLAVTAENGHRWGLNLARVTNLCQQEPGECDAALDHQVASFVEAVRGELKPLSREAIRAVIKDPRFFEAAKQSLGQDPDLVRRRLAGDLFVVYVEEGARTSRFLKREHLQKLKLNQDELHALAMRNLDAALKDLPAAELAPGSGVYLVRTRDGYAAARLLVPRLWRSAAKMVKGRLVAIAPSRDTLLYTGAANANDVGAMLAAANGVAQADRYPISPLVLEWTGDGWRAAKGDYKGLDSNLPTR